MEVLSSEMSDKEQQIECEDLKKEIEESVKDTSQSQDREPLLIEKYLSLVSLELRKMKEGLLSPFFFLSFKSQDLPALYASGINNVKCYSKENFLATQDILIQELKETVLDLYTDKTEKSKDDDYIILEMDGNLSVLIFNIYHLFVGIRHYWLVDMDGNKGETFMSLMEKTIFIDSGFKLSFYKVGDKYEPFILDRKTRNRILCEVILELYEKGVLTKEMENKVVMLNFYGDKHLINFWKGGIKMGNPLEIKELGQFEGEAFFSELNKKYEEKKDEEHLFFVNFRHPETKENITFTWFIQSYSALSQIFVL